MSLPLRKMFVEVASLSCTNFLGPARDFFGGGFLNLCIIAMRLLEISEAVIGMDLRSRDRELCISLCFEIHEIPVGPLLQPVKVPLNSGTTIWCASPSSQFCIICELAEGELLSHHPGLMKRINSIGPSVDPWGTPLLNGVFCISVQVCTKGSMLCCQEFLLLLAFIRWGTASKFGNWPKGTRMILWYYLSTWSQIVFRSSCIYLSTLEDLSV